ncbi:MAG: nucleotide sugar dehydrogenase [Candidatus Omnitrophica bacterium]|nr:nucleotide sugar dehydrogenase [Candidatus Omnitrophota bacterium]
MKKDYIKSLKSKIGKKNAALGIIGLGYVGLPLALAFAKKGFRVTGIDVDKDRVRKIKRGISYITDVSNDELKKILKRERFETTTNFKMIRKMDAVIICVPTPMGKNKEPDISYIREAVTNVKNNIRKGQIIVLESTTYPGTTREILLPELESTGLKEGKDFYLAFSPERIDPANKIYKTENTPKIIGGISRKSTQIAKFLYDRAIKEVIPVSSADAAEMVKLLENTFRIVNIALVNEIATLCNKFSLDTWEIIDAAKSKPYGFMPFYPGPGCGGHCIPVDPLYLSWKAKEHGFDTKFINLASQVNESMPQYVIERLDGILAAHNKTLNKSKILVLGVAYKKNVKDLRESPAIDIIRILERRGVGVSFYDPLFPFLKINGINLKRTPFTGSFLKSQDAVIIATDHTGLDYKFLAGHSSIILDTRGILRKIPDIKRAKSKGRIFNL